MYRQFKVLFLVGVMVGRPMAFASPSVADLKVASAKGRSVSLSTTEPPNVSVYQPEELPTTDQSSAHIRGQKNWGANYRTGQSFGLNGSHGFDLYHIYNKKIQYGLLYTSDLQLPIDLSDLYVSSGLDRESFHFHSDIVEGYGRYFFGNSFAVKIGLVYQKTAYSFTFSPTDRVEEGTNRSKARTEMLGVDITIGNYWSWTNGFTFGIDWLGLVKPLHFAKQNTRTISGYSLEEISRNSQFLEAGINSTSPGLGYSILNVTMGYNF